MKKGNFIVRYKGYENTIQFPDKINSFIITHFASALNEWKSRRTYGRPLFIDFSAVHNPYSNGMLPIIATITKLRAEGHPIKVRLPNDRNVAELFVRTNWAHYLDSQYKSCSGYGRHMHTRQFTDYKEVADLTNDFMDVIINSIRVSKDILSALEWSIYEICDNVINHSESNVGGFVEAVTYSKESRVSFTVADAGRGILNSLKEGFPNLKTNVQAIGEAVKTGVTRNKEVGQGNGLAGSLRITTMSGGSLDITSGCGRIYCTNGQSNEIENAKNQFFSGTSVSGHIMTNSKFSIGKALDFGGAEYIPLNVIDLKYESPDEDIFLMNMNTETTGVGTRKAGKGLRIKTLNIISSKPDLPIHIDWEGIPVISSSFADEFIGKLFIELGKDVFNIKIRNKNMEQLVQQLIHKAISQRVEQEKQKH